MAATQDEFLRQAHRSRPPAPLAGGCAPAFVPGGPGLAGPLSRPKTPLPRHGAARTCRCARVRAQAVSRYVGSRWLSLSGVAYLAPILLRIAVAWKGTDLEPISPARIAHRVSSRECSPYMERQIKGLVQCGRRRRAPNEFRKSNERWEEWERRRSYSGLAMASPNTRRSTAFLRLLDLLFPLHSVPFLDSLEAISSDSHLVCVSMVRTYRLRAIIRPAS